ncbi:unnamed protein product, partial [Nesidiocoris tenuis]
MMKENELRKNVGRGQLGLKEPTADWLVNVSTYYIMLSECLRVNTVCVKWLRCHWAKFHLVERVAGVGTDGNNGNNSLSISNSLICTIITTKDDES